MEMPRLKYAVPIYLIVLGVAWLLKALQVAPGINWVTAVGIGMLGVLAMYVFSLNKVTVILGSLLIVESSCSLLKQTGILHNAGEVPILVIATGCLLLLVQILKLPTWKY